MTSKQQAKAMAKKCASAAKAAITSGEFAVNDEAYFFDVLLPATLLPIPLEELLEAFRTAVYDGSNSPEFTKAEINLRNKGVKP